MTVHAVVTSPAPTGGKDAMGIFGTAGSDGENQSPIFGIGHKEIEFDSFRQDSLGIFTGGFPFYSRVWSNNSTDGK